MKKGIFLTLIFAFIFLLAVSGQEFGFFKITETDGTSEIITNPIWIRNPPVETGREYFYEGNVISQQQMYDIDKTLFQYISSDQLELDVFADDGTSKNAYLRMAKIKRLSIGEYQDHPERYPGYKNAVLTTALGQSMNVVLYAWNIIALSGEDANLGGIIKIPFDNIVAIDGAETPENLPGTK